MERLCALPTSSLCQQWAHLDTLPEQTVGEERTTRSSRKHAEVELQHCEKLRNELWMHDGQMRGAFRKSCRCLRGKRGKNWKKKKEARPYTGNLLYLSLDRNAEMFLLKQREKHFQYSNENAVAVPMNCTAGFVLEQV